MLGLYSQLGMHQLNVGQRTRPVKKMFQNFMSNQDANQANNSKIIRSWLNQAYLAPDLTNQYCTYQEENNQIYGCINFCDLNKACPEKAFYCPTLTF